MTDTIRQVDAGELHALHALVQRAYRGDAARAGWTHEADLLEGERIAVGELASLIASPAEAILVARSGAALVGCIRVADLGDGRAYLGLLCVDPGLQRGGLGRRLIAAAEDHARRAFAARHMEMTVIDSRVELIAWYERRGYVREGTCPFPSPVEPPLAMVVLGRAL